MAAGAPPPLFRRRGFYLHAGFVYEYPFAVRRWTRDDHAGMFRLLRRLGFDEVMTWPMVEAAPPPLSAADAACFRDYRGIIEDAHAAGLECRLAFTPNLSSREEIRTVPGIRDRVWTARNQRTFRFDRPGELDAWLEHTGRLLQCLNNADGYVFIDGDPGGYPEARPAELLAMLEGVRRELGKAAPGRSPEIAHWLWCGWGSDWRKDGVWKSDLKSLVRAVLRAMKARPPSEPWALMPGRHMTEARGNGRAVLELVEEAGMMDRSTLMLYEIVEIEPSPPAVIVQFDDIRRVLRQELKPAPAARGVMANAQTPLTCLHNLFYFARCTGDPAWLDKPDGEVLEEFARFLGGDPRALVPAWGALQPRADQIPEGAVERLRGAELRSEAAGLIPGGADRYLEALAGFLQARLEVARSVASPPRGAGEAAERLGRATAALARWWSRHRFVRDHEVAGGPGFALEFTPRALARPVREWVRASGRFLADPAARRGLAGRLAGDAALPAEVAEKAVDDLREWARPA